MLTLPERIKTLQTLIQQNNLSPENKQILLKEIQRLKQELAQQESK
jgi:hypothetical protein